MIKRKKLFAVRSLLLILSFIVLGCGQEGKSKAVTELTGTWKSGCVTYTNNTSSIDNWTFDGGTATKTQQFWSTPAGNITCTGTNDAEVVREYNMTLGGDNPNVSGAKYINLSLNTTVTCSLALLSGCITTTPASTTSAFGTYAVNNDSNILTLRLSDDIENAQESDRQQLLDQQSIEHVRISSENDNVSSN